MRIALLTAADLLAGVPMGGTLAYVRAVLPHFTADVQVFGCTLTGAPPDSDRIPGTSVPFRGLYRTGYPTTVPHRLKSFIGFAARRSAVLAWRPDVIYTHNAEITLPYLNNARTIPVVFHQHGRAGLIALSPRRLARSGIVCAASDRMYDRIYAHADWIVAVGPEVAREAESRGAGGRTTMVMNPVDTRVFHPGAADVNATRSRYGLPLNGRLLLFVGRLEPLKRVDVVVEAVALLTGSNGLDARLVVAGDGSQRSALEALVRSRGLGRRVHFIGQAARAELAGLYAAADCVLLPSESEGVPITVLESLASGTPVVATRVGGLPRLLAEPMTGELIARPDARLLADAVAGVLAAPPDRHAVAVAAGRYDSRRVTADLEALLARIVEEKGRAIATRSPSIRRSRKQGGHGALTPPPTVE